MSLLDEQANVPYALMADKPFVDPNTQIREHFERIVTVTGDLYEGPGGHQVVATKQVVAQAAGSAQNPCAAKNPAAAPRQ